MTILYFNFSVGLSFYLVEKVCSNKCLTFYNSFLASLSNELLKRVFWLAVVIFFRFLECVICTDLPYFYSQYTGFGIILLLIVSH